MADLERSVLEVQEFLDPEKGEIRLDFRIAWVFPLFPRLYRLSKLHPNVKFRFKQGMYPSLIQDVMRGEVDFAFVSPCPEQHDHVTGEMVLTEELFAILPPNHPLAGVVKHRFN